MKIEEPWSSSNEESAVKSKESKEESPNPCP